LFRGAASVRGARGARCGQKVRGVARACGGGAWLLPELTQALVGSGAFQATSTDLVFGTAWTSIG
jgi:hypothetical protein